jgi:hypothetical protein
MLCDMARMTLAHQREHLRHAVCHGSSQRSGGDPRRRRGLVYKITSKGYRGALRILCRRAVADGHTHYFADDVWDLYDLWA